MADFQSEVRMFQPEGWVGGFYSNAPFTVSTYMADVDLTVGTFVFNKNQGQPFASRLDPRKVGYQTTGGTQPSCGLVIRPGNIGVLWPFGPGAPANGATNIIPATLNALVASKGEFMLYVPEVADGTATVGMQLTCTDVETGEVGAVADGTAGAEPWWIVEIFDGAVPGLCGVSSWRKG